jgi:hypothetical protein
VHGDEAHGRLALGDTWLDRDVLAALSIPLDRPSPFRACVVGLAPYFGRLGEEPIGAHALTALGRKPPQPGLLLPIVLRDRTVALLYGDAAGAPVEAEVVADLSTTAVAAARSFQRLILRSKGAEYARPAPQPVAKARIDGASEAGDGEPPKKTPQRATAEQPPGGMAVAVEAAAPVAPPSAGEWRRARAEEQSGKLRGTVAVGGFPTLAQSWAGEIEPQNGSRRQPEPPREKIVARDVMPAADDLDMLVDLVSGGDARAESAAWALLAASDRGARAVVARLPGPLRIERHTLKAPTPPLAEHGPLLALLDRFGEVAVPALLSRTVDASLEARYYATLALGQLRVPRAVPAIGMRLFDPDASVRRVALELLPRFGQSPELRTLTESLRGELPGPDVARQLHAAEALGVLRDVSSVPRLIELVKHEHVHLAQTARRALVEITKQDFGSSRWRWRSWWERHRNEPRLEWMLEGLAHVEAEVRMSASEELKAMTTEYFGYQFDMPKREREEARRKWVDWWRANGSKPGLR